MNEPTCIDRDTLYALVRSITCTLAEAQGQAEWASGKIDVPAPSRHAQSLRAACQTAAAECARVIDFARRLVETSDPVPAVRIAGLGLAAGRACADADRASESIRQYALRHGYAA